MTAKQIEQLNVKIAKKLGWKKFRMERTPFETRRMTGVAPENVRHQFVPNYLGNLAYAMKCVDWAFAKGYTFKMYNLSERIGFEVTFVDAAGIVGSAFAQQPTIAICIAFLKIKE